MVQRRGCHRVEPAPASLFYTKVLPLLHLTIFLCHFYLGQACVDCPPLFREAYIAAISLPKSPLSPAHWSNTSASLLNSTVRPKSTRQSWVSFQSSRSSKEPSSSLSWDRARRPATFYHSTITKYLCCSFPSALFFGFALPRAADAQKSPTLVSYPGGETRGPTDCSVSTEQSTVSTHSTRNKGGQCIASGSPSLFFLFSTTPNPLPAIRHSKPPNKRRRTSICRQHSPMHDISSWPPYLFLLLS